jgi:uncharacterized iron-regulated membrane protein
MNPRTLRQLHRWLGLIFSVSALLASSSGVIHNVMTWTQEPPPRALPNSPVIDAATVKIALADAIRAVPDAAAQGTKAVNLRVIAGEPTYVIWPRESRSPSYVSAVTGRLEPDRDEAFAREIATRFLGGKPATKAGYLTAFDSEYIAIFRILPVYRFDTGDAQGTRVYVSTMTESVTRHTDDGRQVEARIFTNLHKLGFIPDKTVRDIVLTATTGGIFLVSVAGLWLFFATRPRTTG